MKFYSNDTILILYNLLCGINLTTLKMSLTQLKLKPAYLKHWHMYIWLQLFSDWKQKSFFLPFNEFKNVLSPHILVRTFSLICSRCLYYSVGTLPSALIPLFHVHVVALLLDTLCINKLIVLNCNQFS